MNPTCLECGVQISNQVYDFSTNGFGIPLCMPHQNWVKRQETISTNETLCLYLALKHRGVPAKLELFDGHKHIDIAIPEAKVNLEVDGAHHNYNDRQALSDLQRTFFSFMKGYLTIRIPNSLVRNHLEDTADMITGMLSYNRDKVLREYVKYKSF